MASEKSTIEPYTSSGAHTCNNTHGGRRCDFCFELIEEPTNVVGSGAIAGFSPFLFITRRKERRRKNGSKQRKS